MKLIIAGGRDYQFTFDDVGYLDDLRAILAAGGTPIELVVSGAAPGADECGERWAEARGIPARRFPALWRIHGNSAGPIRNRQMAEFVGPDGGVVLFPGGAGTASMRREAIRVGVRLFGPVPASINTRGGQS